MFWKKYKLNDEKSCLYIILYRFFGRFNETKLLSKMFSCNAFDEEDVSNGGYEQALHVLNTSKVKN